MKNLTEKIAEPIKNIFHLIKNKNELLLLLNIEDI